MVHVLGAGQQVEIDLSVTAMGGWSFVSNVHEEGCYK